MAGVGVDMIGANWLIDKGAAACFTMSSTVWKPGSFKQMHNQQSALNKHRKLSNKFRLIVFSHLQGVSILKDVYSVTKQFVKCKW